MTEPRSYGDSCGIARALDLAGERWALLIVRELLLGPKRFTDLRRGLPRVSPDVLAQRLRELETAGLVLRRQLPPPAAARVYELTDRGSELEPILVALGRWGSRVALPDGAPDLSPDALAVALKTMFQPTADDGQEWRYQLRLGEHAFAVRAGGREIDVRCGELAPPAETITTDPATLAALLWHGRRLEDAIAAGTLAASGTRRALVQFLARFGGTATAEGAAE